MHGLTFDPGQRRVLLLVVDILTFFATLSKNWAKLVNYFVREIGKMVLRELILKQIKILKFDRFSQHFKFSSRNFALIGDQDAVEGV